MMRFFGILILLLLDPVLSDAQPNWLWVKASDVQNEASGSDVVVDSAGNIYVAGNFQAPGISLDSITLLSQGQDDFFIAKYDPDGKVVWAKSFGGTNSDRVSKIVLDQHGDLVICGSFKSSSIIFDADTSINHGDFDVFLFKADTAAGNIIWTKNIYSINEDDVYALETDNSNNILISGFYRSDDIHFDSLVLQSSNWLHFLVKYNSDGDAVWAKSIEDSANVYSLCTDNTNNIILTGYFIGQCTAFGNDTLVSISGTDYYNLGGGDIYIAKLDSNGNPVKAISFGGSDHDEGKAVKCSESGSIYFAGNLFSPYIIINSDTFYNPGVLQQICTITIKMDSAFNIQWHDEYAALCNTAMDLAIGLDNDLFLLAAGPYYSYISNVFLVKYDTLGNTHWEKISGGIDVSRGDGLAVDRQGAVVVTGSTSLPSYFDGIYIQSINYPAYYANNFFLAKTDTLCGIPASLNHPEICSGDSTVLYVSGTGNYLWSTGDTTASISIFPAVSTTYSVTVTNDSCRGVASTSVLVHPHPVTPFVHLSGDTLFSDAPGGNQWYQEPGGIIYGANNDYYIPGTNGNYYVIVTDNNGCISDSSNHVSFYQVLVPDTASSDGYTIFPNPGNGVFEIEFKNKQVSDTKICVSDIMGALVFEHNYPAGAKLLLNLSNLSDGVYTITLQNNEVFISSKIIKINQPH